MEPVSDVMGTTQQSYSTGHKKKKVKRGLSAESSRTIIGTHIQPKKPKYGK